MFASTPQREAPSLEVLHLCCSQLQPSTSSLGRFYSELVIVHSSGRWHCVDFLNCWLQELQLMQLSMNASRVVGGLWHCCNCHHNIQLPAFQLTRLVYSFHFAAACKSARVSNLQQDTRPTVHPGNLCRAATRSRQAQCVWRPRSRCPAEPGCHRSHRGRCRCKRCPRNVYPGERCCSWMHCGRTTLLPKRDRRWQVASWMLPVQAAFLHLPSRCSEKRLLDASWMLPVQAGFFYRRPRRSEKRLLDAAWMLLVQAGFFYRRPRRSEKRLLDAAWMLPVQAGFLHRRPRRSEKRLLDESWMLPVRAASLGRRPPAGPGAGGILATFTTDTKSAAAHIADAAGVDAVRRSVQLAHSASCPELHLKRIWFTQIFLYPIWNRNRLQFIIESPI